MHYYTIVDWLHFLQFVHSFLVVEDRVVELLRHEAESVGCNEHRQVHEPEYNGDRQI